MQRRKHIITYHTRKPGQFVSVHTLSDVFMCDYEMGLNNCLKIVRKCQTKKE